MRLSEFQSFTENCGNRTTVRRSLPLIARFTYQYAAFYGVTKRSRDGLGRTAVFGHSFYPEFDRKTELKIFN